VLIQGPAIDTNFTADEWYRLTPVERVRRCHLMATESRQLANKNENLSVKEAYLTLATQWLVLAAELERETSGDRA
jgi:hypothetical protein